MIRLRPPKHPIQIRRWQRPKEKPMTAGVAAACDSGRKVVCATDGLLSYGSITADTLLAGKFTWLDDWCCLFAGKPSHVEMIFEKLDEIAHGEKLTRRNIKPLIRQAYQKRMADCLTASVLSPYDVTMEEFKKDG